MAVASADELLEQARRERADARRDRERARTEAEEILRAAVGERERLDEEAAEERRRADRAATAQLLAVQEQVDALRRQRDEARQSLRRLTDQIGQALQAVVGTLPDGDRAAGRCRAVPRVRMVDNVVADGAGRRGAEDRQRPSTGVRSRCGPEPSRRVTRLPGSGRLAVRSGGNDGRRP